MTGGRGTRPGRRRAPVHSKTHPAGTAMRRLTRVSDQLGGGPAASGSGSDAAATAAELEYEYDLLIVGGRVICPATNTDRLADLAVKDGLIAALLPAGSAASHGSAREVVDASGLLVTPGLVDLHAHGYQHVEPIGLDFDEQCLRHCTTTVVDAGSTGATHFPGFRKYIIERCQTRVLSLLNISLIGAGRAPALGDSAVSLGSGDVSQKGGGLQSPAHISVAHTVDCIRQNDDVIVGIKVALSRSWASEYPGGPEAGEAAGYEAALQASAATGLPLMTHHTFSSVPLSECPGRLRAGDIYTHCLHGFESTIIATTTPTTTEHDGQQQQEEPGADAAGDTGGDTAAASRVQREQGQEEGKEGEQEEEEGHGGVEKVRRRFFLTSNDR